MNRNYSLGNEKGSYALCFEHFIVFQIKEFYLADTDEKCVSNNEAVFLTFVLLLFADGQDK